MFHAAVNFAPGLYQAGAITGGWAVEGIIALVVVPVCLCTYKIWDSCSKKYSALLAYEPADWGL